MCVYVCEKEKENARKENCVCMVARLSISQAHPHHPGELRLILVGGTSPLSLHLAGEEGSLPKETMTRLTQDEPVEGE